MRMATGTDFNPSPCSRILRTLCLSLTLAAIAGAPVGAQDAALPGDGETAVVPVPQEPDAPPAAELVFEDIVVTATKREQLAREIPGSVTAITGAALEESGARGQEDFLKLVPGVSLYQEEPNRSRITIRGIAADNGTSQAAGTLIDDVPFTDPFIADLSPDLAPFDLDTVEVLKGPQGTLFGASALGGAVRYVLRPAALGDWQAHGFVSGADLAHGGREPAYGVAVNAPVHDRLALRVVGTQWDRPGVIDETGRNEPDVDRSRQQSYRALFRFVPHDRLEVRGGRLLQETATADLGFVDNDDGELSRDSTPTASPVNSDFSLDQVTANYAFDWATLTSASGRVTKFIDIDADTSRAAPTTRQFARATVEGYTQELRLGSPDDGAADWQWLAGAFFMHYDTFRRVDVVSAAPTVAGMPLPQAAHNPGTTNLSGGDTGLVARFDLDATARELAAFGEVTRRFGSRVDATLGARVYRTSSVGVATASGPLNVALTGEQESRNHADLEEQGVSPKIALRYRWSEAVLVYGLTSRGFRFGGIELIGDTAADDIPPTYKSDHVWLYEAGLRTAWFGGKLRADAAVYRLDWTDPQLTQLTESGTLLYVDNVGGARTEGVEGALQFVTPLRGLTLGGTAAYTDARTTEPFTTSSGAQVPEGRRWPFTADRQLAADVTYALELGAVHLAPAVVYGYTGGGYSDIENTVPVFGYSTLDLHLGIGCAALPGAPELALSATNLLDERGVASHSVANGIHTIYYTRPLTVSAQLTLRF